MYLFFLLLFLPFSLIAEEPEVVRVVVSSENPLYPVFVQKIVHDESISTALSEELQDAFIFDWSHNARTSVIKDVPEKMKKASFDQSDLLESMEKIGLYYLVLWEVKNRSLSVRLFSSPERKAWTIDAITLLGDTAKDRKTIHRLSDTIFEILFSEQGIASEEILFSLQDPLNPKTTSIYKADYDGKNPVKLTKTETLHVLPKKIPHTQDGYIYVSYAHGQSKIMYANTTQSSRAVFLHGNQMTPAISQDGSYIAFSCDATGNTDLFLQRFDKTVGPIGKPQQIFTAKGAANASPAFSPDGKKIAFVSNKDGSPKIYIIDTPQKECSIKDIRPILISTSCRENTAPSWSPDGKKLAYAAKNSANRQIWIYDFETKREYPITSSTENKENPVWAKDSLHLFYNSCEHDAQELYLVDILNKKPSLLATIPGKKQFPAA